MSKILKKCWYVIKTYSGSEKQIVTALREQIKLSSVTDLFGEILIPIEQITEIRAGKRYKSERKFFPGYILIQMIMNDSSWHIVKNTSRVVGFLGSTTNYPIPITDQEMNIIIRKLQFLKNKLQPKIMFELGEQIRVNKGPFTDFYGTVEEIDYTKNHLKVLVSVFGRTTSVELDFAQVEKIK